MPRAERRDDFGALHHVINRGLARRTVFESAHDKRCFLALVARAVRRGAIELHEFTLLSTHFHLLVRSVRGDLSRTIGRIEHAYVRWFNRSRDRDGSLFRGRFTSRRVDHPEYERAVRLYIADNAVAAGMVARPVDHPWCSSHVRSRRRACRWLASPPHAFRAPSAAELHDARWMVEQRANRSARSGIDPWRELAAASAPALAAWMRRRARIADGSTPLLPATTPRALERALDVAARSNLRHRLAATKDHRTAIELRCGLLRELCALRWKAIAELVSIPPTSAHRAANRHRARLRVDESYAAAVASIARAAMAALDHELNRVDRAVTHADRHVG